MNVSIILFILLIKQRSPWNKGTLFGSSQYDGDANKEAFPIVYLKLLSCPVLQLLISIYS